MDDESVGAVQRQKVEVKSSQILWLRICFLAIKFLLFLPLPSFVLSR
jgi:hypothetical protein